jgi:hypothetical protein
LRFLIEKERTIDDLASESSPLVFRRNGITQMTVMTAATLLVLFLPFLLSLAGQAGQPKMLCLVKSLLALLLSFDPYRVALPWALGMAISVISVLESFHQRRATSARNDF